MRPTYFTPPKQRRIGGIWGERTRRPRAQILGRISRGASHGRGEEFASRSVAACRLPAASSFVNDPALAQEPLSPASLSVDHNRE